jgi:hypothetical protein
MFGHALFQFRDDENFFHEDETEEDDDQNNDDEEISIEEIPNEDSMSDEPFMNDLLIDQGKDKKQQQQQQQPQSIRFLLENPVRFTKTMPITGQQQQQNVATGQQKKLDFNNNTNNNMNKNDLINVEAINSGDGNKVIYANQNSLNSAQSPPTLAGYL